MKVHSFSRPEGARGRSSWWELSDAPSLWKGFAWQELTTGMGKGVGISKLQPRTTEEICCLNTIVLLLLYSI